jgi:hypothetical protein
VGRKGWRIEGSVYVSAGTAEEDHDAAARAGEGGLEKANRQRHRSAGGAQRPSVVLDRPGVALQLLQDRLQRELHLQANHKGREEINTTSLMEKRARSGKMYVVRR